MLNTTNEAKQTSLRLFVPLWRKEGICDLLEALRAMPGQPRMVVAGSMAAMGSCTKVNDDTRFLPNNTYGMTKVGSSPLVSACHYSRQGVLLLLRGVCVVLCRP